MIFLCLALCSSCQERKKVHHQVEYWIFGPEPHHMNPTKSPVPTMNQNDVAIFDSFIVDLIAGVFGFISFVATVVLVYLCCCREDDKDVPKVERAHTRSKRVCVQPNYVQYPQYIYVPQTDPQQVQYPAQPMVQPVQYPAQPVVQQVRSPQPVQYPAQPVVQQVRSPQPVQYPAQPMVQPVQYPAQPVVQQVQYPAQPRFNRVGY